MSPVPRKVLMGGHLYGPDWCRPVHICSKQVATLNSPLPRLGKSRIHGGCVEEVPAHDVFSGRLCTFVPSGILQGAWYPMLSGTGTRLAWGGVYSSVWSNFCAVDRWLRRDRIKPPYRRLRTVIRSASILLRNGDAHPRPAAQRA
jgi:hypothetical protein